MKYVIIRDDDTNALIPVDCLERLYRPFLDRGFPVNLATIPNVCTVGDRFPGGKPEQFLMAKKGEVAEHLPMSSNPTLVRYLLDNRGYHIVQHGWDHACVEGHFEFDHDNSEEIGRRLDEGSRLLQEAGFSKPVTFVAPYDKLSKASLEEVSRRFQVLSTGWYELRRLPVSWWPRYAIKKTLKNPHWRVGKTHLLSHPGCHLSYHRAYGSMLDEIIKSIESRQVTVLVTHWWEYFRNNTPDDAFIDVLHETALYLARRKDIKVISFDDVAQGSIPLN